METMDRFKVFLLNEERSFLGRKVGDVLTAMQDVQQDMPNLGQRHLTKIAENLVNQIRKILHGRWSPKYQKDLRELQKVAVAIMRTIEEKGDLKEILPTATQTVQTLSGKLGVKVNNLEAPEQLPGQDATPQDFQMTGMGPAQQQGQAPGGQPPQDPSGGQAPGGQPGAQPPPQGAPQTGTMGNMM
jgi:hypothetical protein